MIRLTPHRRRREAISSCAARNGFIALLGLRSSRSGNSPRFVIPTEVVRSIT
jgi:hypothetical protein